MAARKLATKTWRSDGCALVLVHMRAACVALGSERDGVVLKVRNMSILRIEKAISGS